MQRIASHSRHLSFLRCSRRCPLGTSTTTANAFGAGSRFFCQKIKVYTKTGDNGTSSLFNLERRKKDDLHFIALGDTDELNAQLGVVNEHIRCLSPDHPAYQLVDQITEIQSRLFDVGSHVATPLSTSSDKHIAVSAFPVESVQKLEGWIDGMEEDLPPIRNWVVPSGGMISVHMHVARTVTRRSERSVVSLSELGDVDPSVQRYLNRLSDYLFVAGRYCSHTQQQEETLYKKARHR